MGEAKLRRRRTEAFTKQHPYCCYCGGSTPATTVDHVPSIQMFALRRRPRGLEVPACQACNGATRQHEQVAALLGRIYPDGPTAAERDEMKRIMHAIKNNVPGLLEGMKPSPSQHERFAAASASVPIDAAGVLNCSGPLLNHSVQIFGAKLGFALHYANTGHIVPPSGGVAVRWYSNFERLTGDMPQDFLQMLGPPETLRQGRWDVGGQFEFAWAATPNAKLAAYFSTYRKSFAVVSWVSEDGSSFEGVENIQVHRPGQF